MSRIGKLPIKLPTGVDINLGIENKINIKSKLGEMSHTYPTCLDVVEENNNISVKRNDNTRESAKMQGLFRSLISNSVMGLDKKFEKILELQGVGYRAQVAGQSITLNLGFSHPVILEIPENVDVLVKANTTISIMGFDKEKVGLFASQIRDRRPPEPYKGKGVKYKDEIILRKAGKSGK
jgi:large subunit ribosomal protein L6